MEILRKQKKSIKTGRELCKREHRFSIVERALIHNKLDKSKVNRMGDMGHIYACRGPVHGPRKHMYGLLYSKLVYVGFPQPVPLGPST